MPGIRPASRFSVLGRRGAWLIVLALALAPGLNPLRQRLGSSVNERGGLNKRSEHPPRRIVDAVVHIAAVSPSPVYRPDPGNRFDTLLYADDTVHTYPTLHAPDSLRAPPSTLSL